jgi:predicted nucleotidyltransferase
MSLFEELIEDKKGDKKIIKSFKSKDTLSNQIFEGDKGKFMMRDDIKTALLKIGDDFIESLGVEFFIHDIVLTGSLANYNWSNFSDVDLHIVIDYKESKYNSEILKEFFDAKKNVWNEKHNIVIKGYDVELYVQDVNEDHVSSGVYSILHNKWIIEPEQKNPNIDDRMILQKGEEYMKKIDNIIEKGKKGVDVLNDIENIRSKIKSFRQSGLDSGGEYSYENLTFKLLRRNGYIGKLLKLKITLTDKKLSVEQ